MGAAAKTRGHFVSSCCLLSSTLAVMLIVFAVEDSLVSPTPSPTGDAFVRKRREVLRTGGVLLPRDEWRERTQKVKEAQQLQGVGDSISDDGFEEFIKLTGEGEALESASQVEEIATEVVFEVFESDETPEGQEERRKEPDSERGGRVVAEEEEEKLSEPSTSDEEALRGERLREAGTKLAEHVDLEQEQSQGGVSWQESASDVPQGTVETSEESTQGRELESEVGGGVSAESESRGDSVELETAAAAAKSREEKKPSKKESKETGAPAPPPVTPVPSVWYYTKIYKHPEAKLRLLTEEDGAGPIRSAIPPREREITIVTQTSADRLKALEATCMTWGGALCVAVHVRLQSEIAPVYTQLKEMHERVEKNGSCRLDTQIATEDGFKTDEEALQALYPVNALRNVALGMAMTDLIFLLDADFYPSPGLHEILTKEETYQEMLRQATEEQQLFVVPAFEVVDIKGHKPTLTVPKTMKTLREEWKNGSIICFHCVKSPTGHTPTMFEKFFNPKTTSPYPIRYRDGFEPYVIGAAKSIPLYDARFRGYGENKVSHIYNCAAEGMGFQVLPNVFVVELPHPPSKAHESYIGRHKDPDQRFRIVGLYRQFRFEVGKKIQHKDAVRYQKFLEDLKNERR